MRSPLLLAAAVALAVLSPRGSAAPLESTPVGSGDRVLGVIDSATDRDLFRLDVADGARLDLSVKAAAKSPFLPRLELYDPAGAPVDVRTLGFGESTRAVGVTDLGVHVTGSWTVAVSGYMGSTGAYQATFRAVMDSKLRTTLTVPAGGTARWDVAGLDGARVTYTVLEKGGLPLAGAGMIGPDGGAVQGAEAVRKGRRLAGKAILLDRGPGRYGVLLRGSPDGEAVVDVTAVVRFQAVKPAKVKLGEEPRPAAITPTSGCDGLTVTLTGTGFAPAARVLFGDSDAATEVTSISATEIRAVAPACDASRKGQPSAISVVNPDGQFGTAPASFAFLGLPKPASVTPALSPLEGGVTASIHGGGFRDGCTVDVGGLPSGLVTFRAANRVDFVAPAHEAGIVDVVVKDEFGRPGPAVPGFWYSDAPDVASAEPSVVSSLGGATITLTGSGFVPGVRVFVAGTAIPLATLDPTTSLSFICPPGKTGLVEVEVRDPIGRSFRGDLLRMTPAMHDGTAESVPSPSSQADFYGDRVALGDLTGDGRPEILVSTGVLRSDPGTGQLLPGTNLLRNDGKGLFTDDTSSRMPRFPEPGDLGQADAVLLGDLDGDGRTDAVLSLAAPLPSAETYVNYQGYKGYYDISFPYQVDPLTGIASRFLKNDGTGTLSEVTETLAPPAPSTPAFGMGERWQASAAALGDLDGDGKADLLLVSGSEVRSGYVGYVSWTYSYVYSYPYGWWQRDKALLQQSTSRVGAARVLRNDGTGAFLDSPGSGPGLLTSPYYGEVVDDFRGVATALGDLDGNGTLDAVILDSSPAEADDGYGGLVEASAIRVLLNDGKGNLSFAPGAISEPTGTWNPASGEWWQGTSLVLADLDGDGDLDIVVGRPEVELWTDPGTGETRLRPAILVFRNDGSGFFQEDTGSFLPPGLVSSATGDTLLGVRGIAAADIDGDGRTDLVVTGRETAPVDPRIPFLERPATRILLNDGKSGLRDATADWFPAGTLPVADALAVGDLDGDGHPDLVLALDGPAPDGGRSVRIFFNR